MLSTFSKRNTFGARTECPSYKQSNKGIRGRRCPFYRDTRLIENSLKRESTAPETEDGPPKLTNEMIW